MSLLFIVHVLPESDFLLADWRREDKSGKHNSHTTGFPGQLHFSFIHLFLYFYLYLQELSWRRLAPQGARSDGFIMLFTCCFTRLASLIFSSKRFSKAHRRPVPAFESLNCIVFFSLRLCFIKYFFRTSGKIQSILLQRREMCFFVCGTKWIAKTEM